MTLTKSAGCPLVIDPSGVWFRPEGNLFICGAPPQGDDPDTEDLTVDHGLFDEMMWPALATVRITASAASMNARVPNTRYEATVTARGSLSER